MSRVAFIFVAGLISMFSSSSIAGAVVENTENQLSEFRSRSIYFAHQSVGRNIVDGVVGIFKQNGQDLHVVEGESFNNLTAPVFLHSKVGQNKLPVSKLEEFRRNITAGIGGNVDIAFLKFCYVDFRAGTDVDAVFQRYKEVFTTLKSNFPDVTFVHFTVPLKTNKVSWKTGLKEFFNFGELWEYQDNVLRNKFNELLRAEFLGREPVFDIARYESTYSGGARTEFEYEEQTYSALDGRYTDDGGHLNTLGRKWIAANLIEFIASLADE